MLYDILKARTKPSDKALYNIWARKISDGWTETTITGSLPLTFRAKGDTLTDYTVYGTSAGAGARTENLWDEDYENISTNLIYKSLYVGDGSFTMSTTTPLGTGGCSLFLMPGEQTSGATTAIYGAYADNPRTVTSVNGYVTVAYRIYDNKNPCDYQTMLVPGSTAPSNYIPYGYQIPLTNTSGVTKNLWDENYENISFNLTYKSINVGDGEFTLSTTAPIYSGSCCLFLMAGQQTSGATTSSDGASANLSRTVTSVGGYVTVVYRKYGTVDPREYKTMLNKGSTALSYIPHRYTADYNLYIGDSKLGEEEYVDYQEQKVYKRTEQLFNKDAQDTNNGFVEGKYLVESGTSYAGPGWDISEYIEVEPNTTYTITPKTSSPTPSIVEYDADKNYVAGHRYYGNTTLTITTDATTKYVRASVIKDSLSTILFVEGSTLPETYIPYLQPTDPPSPLPSITTYEGENTLSSTETVGSVSVSGKIKEVTP